MDDDGGRVALVTGGASGIGRATVERFVAGGWRAVIVDRDAPAAAAVVERLGEERALAVTADVSRPASCDAAVAAGVQWAGRLDHVVCAAGVWTEGPPEHVTEEEWDRVVGVNLKGVFFTVRAAIAPLRATAGAATLLASDAGLQGNRGAVVYCATKGGVVLMAKTLALDLAPDRVRVNAVCPGDVMSPMLRYQADAFGGGDPSAYFGRLLAGYPQGAAARFIEPAEVAELVWFLAQPAAAPITGAALSIDFGLSSGI
jgi:NAD(P)-dependent dehydrogenase (short-subunit alcohol dehydrogenase family)